MTSKKGISVIIPAYNEFPRIRKVLDIVTSHAYINEIIVIDDGSTDGTDTIALHYPGIQFIKLENHKGKSFAVYTGIQASQYDTLALIDADLINFSHDSLTKLVDPVISGKADVSISIRENTLSFWHLIGIDYISGERVLPRSLFDGKLESLTKIAGFGLEVFENEIMVEKKMRIAIVYLHCVIGPWKYKKQTFWKGVRGEFSMIREIITTVSLPKIITQIYRMRQLKTRI